MSDLHTDGNDVAGMLEEFLAAEATTTMRRCQGCHDEYPLAAHRAYHGASAVLRCPGCGEVAVLISERDDELVLEWRGWYRIPRAS
jgi:hypothetical protein